MIDRQWASIAVNTCVAAGVQHFFLAPGSRCTPLTLAVAEHPDSRVTQHFDERALAFAALGYARATGRPGIFVCTSGTAVANAYPALIEASMEGVPLLLWTADRPPELRNTGANQTIDQQHIFGTYPNWFCDLPCPTDALSPSFVQSIVRRALGEAETGPVHLNWMFREPFGFDALPIVNESAELDGGCAGSESKSGTEIQLTGDTVLVAGGCQADEARVIWQLAEHYDVPLITDITSGLRGISADLSVGLPEPKTIVHFGGRIVSKTWQRWTASLETTRFIHVTPKGIHFNPNHLPQQRYVEPIRHVQFVQSDRNSAAFNIAWRTADSDYRKRVDRVFREHRNESQPNLTEPELAYEVGKLTPDGHALFLGNSSPIRDFDRYAFWPVAKDIAVGANRGASGIDGLIATSVGFADGFGRPTTAVVGDLSALHDLNALALVAKSAQPLTLVIINNQAGAIFDMLPVARRTEHFEQYFATPHGFSFQHAASMFGLPYVGLSHSDDSAKDAFAWIYEKSVTGGRSGIIEVKTNRDANQRIRQRLQERLQE